ncbi:MAG: hypothetical protein JWN62_66 [Acidimicrobiales bacterium]|nr:hypothetical protein [Acidimicrobiales bacterium]
MLPHLDLNVVMGFYFSPRGGSAQVARYLCRALGGGRWEPALFAGSLGAIAESGNADTFFGGIDCTTLDYSPANADWLHGMDPMTAPIPMHASFEAKPDVPDRIFFGLDDDAYERQVRSWVTHFAGHAPDSPSVVHLHHLTPMHQAVAEVWPHVPVVTHLHGTELKMLARQSVGDDDTEAGSIPWSTQWSERMRRWAGASQRLVVVSDQDRALAGELLGVDDDRISVIANGVDTDVFSSEESPSRAGRLARWRRWLVDEPRGWRPGHPVGSVRYESGEVAEMIGADGEVLPIVLFVGRFMEFKRVRLLIEAHHAMQMSRAVRSVLIIAGGYPGEWEGEHPYDTVQRLGARRVFLAGWRDHAELSEMLGCVDVFAAPSVDEPFGLVYLEAMAAGVAPIATATGGPAKFINVDPDLPTGWLVAPDDRADLVRALTEAVTDDEQLISRGKRAAHFVAERYSWATAAGAFAAIYEDVSSTSGVA